MNTSNTKSADINWSEGSAADPAISAGRLVIENETCRAPNVGDYSSQLTRFRHACRGVAFRFTENQPLSCSAIKQKLEFLSPGPPWNGACN
jgi:hypothetical protein